MSPKQRHSLTHHLRSYFFAGILVSAPLAITAWVFYLAITIVDAQVESLIPSGLNPLDDYALPIPGLGIMIVLVAMIIIGFLATNVFGRLVLSFSEAALSRMPVIRSVYGAVKQIVETVLHTQSQAFREVVLVEYPRRGIYAIGFITGKTGGEVQTLTEDTLISVFVPTTPNPTSGFLLFFPRSELHVLQMTVEEGIKMVISGGIVTPPYTAEDGADLHANRRLPAIGEPEPEPADTSADERAA